MKVSTFILNSEVFAFNLNIEQKLEEQRFIERLDKEKSPIKYEGKKKENFQKSNTYTKIDIRIC